MEGTTTTRPEDTIITCVTCKIYVIYCDDSVFGTDDDHWVAAADGMSALYETHGSIHLACLDEVERNHNEDKCEVCGYSLEGTETVALFMINKIGD